MKKLVLILALACAFTQTPAYADAMRQERECNERAWTFLMSKPAPTTWKSHYNNIYNRCLISIEGLNDEGVTSLVVDIDTGYIFAFFFQKNIFEKNDPKIICGAETLSGERVCKTYLEYHELIEKSYGFYYDHGGIRR
jgi:hypothetical protein